MAGLAVECQVTEPAEGQEPRVGKGPKCGRWYPGRELFRSDCEGVG